MKYGKVDIADLEMTVYDKDTSASAVVLADYGTSTFNYDDTNGWQIMFKRHKRIKILKKDGYDYADVSIDLYDPGDGKEERISAVKGTTYNVEGGKVVKSKLGNNAIFKERKNEFWKSQKFTLPNVKEGSVIEYSYVITSDYIRFLRGWQFQSLIPTRWSEYIVTIPEFFDYQFLSQGYIPLAIHENNTKDEQFQYSWTSLPGLRGKIDKGVSTLESVSKKSRMVMVNVPAFKIELHISSHNNYLSKISFELRTVKYRNELPKNYMGTWPELNKQFLESTSFGKRIAGSNFLSKNLETILSGNESSEEKLTKIFGYVKRNVSWNGFNGIYMQSSNFRELISEKEGNIADINLLLTTLLTKAGLKSEGVLISTRSHGFVRPQYAISRQFNYVICKVEMDGKTYLLDASDSNLPIGMLPQRCLNGKGWVVSATSPGWIDLGTKVKYGEKVVANLSFSETGEISGDIEYRNEGYRAISSRKSYNKKGKDDYVKDAIANSSWEVIEITFENEKELNKPFIEKHSVLLESESEVLGDKIYFNPLIENRQNDNPFKLEKRDYPVDFATPIEDMCYFTFTLPEGYIVEEAPTAMVITLPNGAGKYTYNVSSQGGKVTVMSRLNINKTLFLPEEYPNVKEFFAQVVAKQQQQIVLKKN